MLRSVIRGSTASAIAGSAEQAIQLGVLPPGGLLPPIRALARSLRVSPVTVASAYRRLHARGLLVGDGRRGTRVRPQPPAPTAHTALRRVPGDLVDLANGNPDPALLPPIEAALRGLGASRTLYGAPQHLSALLRFAAEDFEADGVPGGAVTVTGGALDAIERVLREHLRPGDRVVVEDPTLPALLDLLNASGLVAEPVAVDEEGAVPEQVDRALRGNVRALIVTPRGHDPTGAAMSRARAADLKRVLRQRRELLLIEHDPAGPVAGAPLVTLSAAGLSAWAVVRSTSAFLGPDLRVAILAGDPVTISRVQGRQALGTRWISHLLQRLAFALWSDPSNGRRLAHAAEVYAARRRALLDALAARGIPAHGQSGLNVWIPVREETPLVQALAAGGWAVAAGERFRVKSRPGLRITTSALAAEAAAALAADLSAALRS